MIRPLSENRVCTDTFLVAALTCAYGITAHAANPITITSLPTVSSSIIVADDTSTYSVSMIASDGDGYDDITCLRVLFNFTESGGDSAFGRGYLAWGQTDAYITKYGGTWVLDDATGGGRWGYRTDDWGSTTYITPTGCEMTTNGSATGGTGTRTVIWTFTAKPAWAENPLINDADAWAADASTSVGWRDNPVEFDVVTSPCVAYATTPGAPIVLNPTTSTLDVAIDPGDSATDVFAIQISPKVNGVEYVQADGSVGGFAVWQTRDVWGTTTVTGLTSSTEYTCTVRAMNSDPGTCPSSWSPGTVGTTTILTRTIDYTTPISAISRDVTGMTNLPWNISAQRLEDNWSASVSTSVRYGGDGYNWKTRTAQWGSSTFSTLQALRYARDRGSHLQILTNTRGIGTGNGGTWVYTDQSASTLAALAADWVYYCNKLLPTKRQGDALTTEEQAILDSMDWGSDDKLLAPGEASTPIVTYWEIGNEPEGPYPPPPLTPADYATRYKTISSALLAQDATIKVGPCVTTADNGNAWLDAVFSDSDNQVDFVAYHPYGNLYYVTRDTSGGVLNASDLMEGLNVLKEQQASKQQKIIERLVANGRPADTELVLSEWNPSSWQGTYYYGLAQTVAHGLGTAESILGFGELDMTAAQYWESPNHPSTSTIENPCFKVYKTIQAYMGDQLVESCTDGYFRLYATLDTEASRLVLWAINLSDTDDTPVTIHLTGDALAVKSITEWKLAALDGDTSLVIRNDPNDPADTVDWIVTDRTGQIDMSDFTMTFEDATLTMLVFELDFPAQPDNDRDGDVDLADFGAFQACLSGPYIIQTNPACIWAKLDIDSDVDKDDLSIFLQCMSGSDVLADPDCIN